MKIFWFQVSHPDLTTASIPERLRVFSVLAPIEEQARLLAREHIGRDMRYGHDIDGGGNNYSLELIASDAGIIDQKLDHEVGKGPAKLHYDLELQSMDSGDGVRVGGIGTVAEITDEISRELARYAHIKPQDAQSAQGSVSAESKAEAFDAMAEAAGEDESGPSDDDMIPALRGSGVVVRKPNAFELTRFPAARPFPDLVAVEANTDCGDKVGVFLCEDNPEPFSDRSRERLLRSLTHDRELLRLIWLHLAANRDRLPEIEGVSAARLQGEGVRLPIQNLVLVPGEGCSLDGFKVAWSGPDEGSNSTERMRKIATQFREALRLTLRYLLAEAGWELS